MDANDIRDWEICKEWLGTLPAKVGEKRARGITVWLASRSALRVLPIGWRWLAEAGAPTRNLTPIEIIRPVLISSVAAAYPAENISEAAINSAHTPAYTDYPEFDFISAPINTAKSVATNNIAFAASAIALAISAVHSAPDTDPKAARSAMWSMLLPDIEFATGGDFAKPPRLWHTEAPAFSADWRWICDNVTLDWSFWIDWYDGLLEGRPQNWPMLTEIALIAPEHWDAGPDTVNPMIAKIVKRFGQSDEIDVAGDLAREVAKLPKPPASVTARIQRSIVENREALPPTFEAIEGLILLEIQRLQGRNEDRDETLRQISVYLTLYEAITQLRQTIPMQGVVTVAEAERVEGLTKLYLRKLGELPRERVDEVVNGVVNTGIRILRLSLIMGSSALSTSLGLGPYPGVVAGTMVFAPKDAAALLKAAKDAVVALPKT